MNKKLILVVLSTIFLGGCSLSQVWQKEAAETSLSQTDDHKLQAVPSVDDDSSLEGIEEDMANTEFYDEDYSNLDE